MKLKYQASKGNRIKYRFMGITNYDGFYFNQKEKRWQYIDDIISKYVPYSSYQDCDSVRAFIRKLKKAPKGIEFVLESRWLGHNVTGIGSCINN